jgi:hypothetical protein
LYYCDHRNDFLFTAAHPTFKELLSKIQSFNEDVDIKLQRKVQKEPYLINIRTPDEKSFVLEIQTLLEPRVCESGLPRKQGCHPKDSA